MARCGSFLIAFLTINLPSAYQQLQAAFATIHPELEDASRILGATRLQSLLPDHRAAAAHRRDRDLVFYLHRRDAGAFGRDRAVHLADQGDLVLIYDLNESGDLAAISVLGIAMLAITFAVVLAVNQIPVFGANAGAGCGISAVIRASAVEGDAGFRIRVYFAFAHPAPASTRYASTSALSRSSDAVGAPRSTRCSPSASHASTFRSTAGE